jgi:very-short-patch-repair endonuclease
MIYNPKTKQTLALDGTVIEASVLATARRYRKLAMLQQTPQERRSSQILDLMVKLWEVNYVKQKIFFIDANAHFRLDFFFQKYRVAIEIDGKQHDKPKQQEDDTRRALLLNQLQDITIIRYTNDELTLESLNDSHPLNDTPISVITQRTFDALLNSRYGWKKRLQQLKDESKHLNANANFNYSCVGMKSEQVHQCVSRSIKASSSLHTSTTFNFSHPLDRETTPQQDNQRYGPTP